MKDLSLRLLQQAITIDKMEQQDRITSVFSEDEGWKFGGEEERSAPKEVQICLSQHEAIAYRPPNPGGRSCHEFPAMIDHLLTKLGLFGSCGTQGGGLPCLTNPMSSSCDSLQIQLASANDQIVQQNELLQQRDLEIEALRAQLRRHRLLPVSAASGALLSEDEINDGEGAFAELDFTPRRFSLHRSVSANSSASEGIPPEPEALSRASSVGSWRSVDTAGTPLGSPPLDKSISEAWSPREM